MATDVLELEDSFDARDLAKKAREAAAEFAGEESVADEERSVLLLLNAGLSNFLTSEYAQQEPEVGTEGEEAVEAWGEFATEIAYSYDRIADDGYMMFHHEDTLADVLSSQAEELEVLKNLPAYIENAINWDKVRQYIVSTGGTAEMFIDGETYVSNVYLHAN